MQALSIPDRECRYYDYSQAAAFFKEIGCENSPQLGVLLYNNGEDYCRTIGWCSEEEDQYQDVPVFKSFEDKEEYDNVTFIPMSEHEIFVVDERLYITVSVAGGLGIRRINLLFDESIVCALNNIRGLPEMEYELCQIYTADRRHEFLGYHWIGKWDTDASGILPQLTISPVFGGDENIFQTQNLSELEIITMKNGETFVKLGTLWQVSCNKQYGTSLIHIVDIPDGSQSGKYMLN